MRKFEVGKIYGEHSVKFEIIRRTAKTVTYRKIQHLWRYNERKSEEIKAKIKEWGDCEVIFSSDEAVTA